MSNWPIFAYFVRIVKGILFPPIIVALKQENAATLAKI